MILNRVVKWVAVIFFSVNSLSVLAEEETGWVREHNAVVLESLEGGGYTYMHVEEQGQKFWVAVAQIAVKVGDKVSFSEQTWMENFTSKTLNRTFDKVLFASSVNNSSSPAHPSSTVLATAPKEKPQKKIAQVADSYSIEEIFAQKSALKDQQIKVRGEVMKVSKNVMGRTWVHIQDGTGSEGRDKIIFRSADDSAEVGSIVTAQGRLELDREFGYGYAYELLVEDSSFSE